GKPTNKLKQTGKTRKTGTKVTFHPDPTIFDKTEYSFDTLSQRLRELAFLNKGLKITLTDERTEKTAEFKFTGGIGEFVKHLNRGKSTLHDSPIYMEGKRGNVEIEIALAFHVEDRKSTRLNSSHDQISYAVFCLKKKKK